jgi:acetyl-CoA C-acetyltransferase
MPSRGSSQRPVLAGAGACHDHVDPTELMVRAVFAAADDAGSRRLLAQVEQIAIPRGTWVAKNPGPVIAERVGAPAARTVIADVGVPQQTLISRTLAAIVAGDLAVAVVVGGEARAWAAAQRRAGEEEVQPDSPRPPEEVLTPGRVIVGDAEIAARFWQPVQQYATIDQALLAAEAGDVAEIDELWARCNFVATTNPLAAFPTRRDAASLRAVSDDNRPLAAPYRKWHSTQWNVNQAAALLLCSEEAARAAGLDPARVLHPIVALESSFLATLPERREMYRWPAMRVLGAAASAAMHGRPLDSIEHVELYSCFPAAVRVQQRELGLPLDGTPTVTGGMAFAGGPFNNFTYQATVAMVSRLRADPGALGMVTTVSGLLTKPGLMVWGTQPAGDVLIADMAEQAATATATDEVAVGYDGEATVAAATAVYTADDPSEAIVVADTVDGRRCVARSDDPAMAAAADALQLIGARIAVSGPSFRSV